MLPPKYFGKNGLLPKQAMVADTKNASKEEYDDEDYAYYDDSYDTDSESNEIAEVPKKQPSTVKRESDVFSLILFWILFLALCTL